MVKSGAGRRVSYDVSSVAPAVPRRSRHRGDALCPNIQERLLTQIVVEFAIGFLFMLWRAFVKPGALNHSTRVVGIHEPPAPVDLFGISLSTAMSVAARRSGLPSRPSRVAPRSLGEVS